MSALNVLEALHQHHDQISMKLAYLSDCAPATRKDNLSSFLYQLKQAEERLNSNEHLLGLSDPRKEKVVQELLGLEPTDLQFSEKVLQYRHELDSILEEERKAISAKLSSLRSSEELQTIAHTIGGMADMMVIM